MCIVGITRTLMLNFKIHKTSAVLGRITITSNINSLTRAIVISVLNISFKSLFQKVKLKPVGLQPCRGFSFSRASTVTARESVDTGIYSLP